MTKLELFLILFIVNHQKKILIPKTNNILKHPMNLGEFIWWLGYWFYIDFWVGIPNRRNCWSTADPKMSGGEPFRLNKYISRNRFEVILGYLRYRVQKYVGYYDGFFHMRKMEESWNLNMDEEFNSAWINVLAGIMMVWFNKYAPGFM